MDQIKLSITYAGLNKTALRGCRFLAQESVTMGKSQPESIHDELPLHPLIAMRAAPHHDVAPEVEHALLRGCELDLGTLARL